jgi:hypothetical protein
MPRVTVSVSGLPTIVTIATTTSDFVTVKVGDDEIFSADLPHESAVLSFLSDGPRNLRQDTRILSLIAALCAIFLSRFPSTETPFIVTRLAESFLESVLGETICQICSPIAAACSVLHQLLDTLSVKLDPILRTIYRLIPLDTEKDGLPTSDISHYIGFAAIRTHLTAISSCPPGTGSSASAVLKSISLGVCLDDDDPGLQPLRHVFNHRSALAAIFIFLLQHTVVPIALLVSLLLSLFPTDISPEFIDDIWQRNATPCATMLHIACDLACLIRMNTLPRDIPDLVTATRLYLTDLAHLPLASGAVKSMATKLLHYSECDLLAWTTRCKRPARQRPPPTRPTAMITLTTAAAAAADSQPSTERWEEEVTLRTGGIDQRKRPLPPTDDLPPPPPPAKKFKIIIPSVTPPARHTVNFNSRPTYYLI